jgi:hypothetical protein
MKMIMVMTKNAAASITQPSKMSSLSCRRERAIATPMLAMNAAPSPKKTERRKSGLSTLFSYASVMPMMSAASTPSRKVTIKASSKGVLLEEITDATQLQLAG